DPARAAREVRRAAGAAGTAAPGRPARDRPPVRAPADERRRLAAEGDLGAHARARRRHGAVARPRGLRRRDRRARRRLARDGAPLPRVPRRVGRARAEPPLRRRGPPRASLPLGRRARVARYAAPPVRQDWSEAPARRATLPGPGWRNWSDAPDLKSGAFGHAGSSPAPGIR